MVEKQIHEDYNMISDLLEYLNIWENPSKKQEVSFREYMRDIVVTRIFESGSKYDIRYGRTVNQNDINPRDFQLTKKVEIKKVKDKKHGQIYKISVKISDMNINDSNRINIYFDGIISRQNGLEAKKPIMIKRN